MKAKIDYSGKKVYIGLDVHKKTYALTAVCEGKVVHKLSMSANAPGLITYLNNNYQGAEIFTAYEAGFSGFGIHHYLEKNGIKNIVVNPASIEIAARDRVKNDRRDSQKIAEHLAQGRLRSIRIPDSAEEDRRQISRGREQVIRHRTSVGNQIKSRLIYFGLLESNDNTVMSEVFLKKVEVLELSAGLRFTLKHLMALWRTLNQQLKEFDRELERQGKQDQTITQIYTSVPGLGMISARTLANELGDMSQFPHERALFNYIGLTPSEHSSGESVHRGHISRQGNPLIRKVLTEVAWRVIRQDSALRADFERISLRLAKKKAIIAVARRLIGRIRACLRKQELFKVSYEPLIKLTA